eukprot:TRINITY_DN11838_c0_g1_i1.p1 TRINITY_DN11838_c0_g1~~TRINITY_DN11838_c0_g1_i1.p1  ORF type:complete len:111 (-),score=19.14 TRINITY_DN11838_c0_g1_i1:180-512(-)
MTVLVGVCFSPSPHALLVCNLLPTLPFTLPYPVIPPTLLYLMATISWSMSTFSTSGMTPSPFPFTFPDLSILLQCLPRQLQSLEDYKDCRSLTWCQRLDCNYWPCFICSS